MKYIVTLLFCALSFSYVSARSSVKKERQQQHSQVIHQLLQQSASEQNNARITAGVASQRVVAQCTHDSTSVIFDSVNVSYISTKMESYYDYNLMFYPYNYQYNKTPMFNYGGVFTKPQVFFDTCMHWMNNPYTLAYGLYENTYATYDVNKCLTGFVDMFTDSATDQNLVFHNTFNTAHNIASGYWFNEVAGATDSTYKQLFTYNTSGKVTEDSIYEYHGASWHIVARTFYTYDANGNLTLIDCFANTMDTTFPTTFPEQAQYTNTYDASHRLATVFTKFWDGTALSQFAKDTFGYTGTGTFHTAWREYEYDDINGYWTPYINMTKTLGTNSLPDTVITQGWDSLLAAWVPQMMDVISYNTSKNPDTLKEFDYNYGYYPDTASYTTVYYYQNYADNTGIITTKSTALNFNIYPNPAQQNITIAKTNGLKNATIEIEFVDVQGRTVLRQVATLQNNSANLSIASLLPGVYQLIIHDGTGSIIFVGGMVKQ